MKPPRRAVAYRITPGDRPAINYFGVVSPDVVLTPQLAVEALRLYGFDEVFVTITQHAASEIREMWTAPLTKHED